MFPIPQVEGSAYLPAPGWAGRMARAVPVEARRGPVDPGSKPLAWMAVIVMVVLLALTAVLQQMAVHGREAKKQAAAGAGGAGGAAIGEVEPPTFDNLMLASKLVSKFTELSEQMKQPSGASMQPMIASLDQTAVEEADRVRLISVIGFNVSPEAAVMRAEELLLPPTVEAESGATAPATGDGGAKPGVGPGVVVIVAEAKKLPPGQRPLKDAKMRADAELLRKVYSTGDASKALTREEAEGLTARHGFYGRLANLHGLAAGDQAREAVVGGGTALLVALLLIGCVVLAAFVAGVVMFIVAVVGFASGRMRAAFVPPTAGGSVPIEMVAVFLAMFMMLKIGSEVLHATTALDEKQLTIIALLAQWSLACVIFYPRLRGVSKAEWKEMLGLRAAAPHRSVMREVGMGILSYLAILPVFVGSALVAVMVLFASQAFSAAGPGGDPPPPPSSPLFELFAGGPLAVVLLASLTMLWAPLVEEVVFRGALFRHLRGRWGVAVAALLSGLVFALLHQYHPAQLIPVFTLGFCFALVREWRGSLIASMVCHCIHNSFVTIVLITLISLLA